jgi:hypothetical protein
LHHKNLTQYFVPKLRRLPLALERWVPPSTIFLLPKRIVFSRLLYFALESVHASRIDAAVSISNEPSRHSALGTTDQDSWIPQNVSDAQRSELRNSGDGDGVGGRRLPASQLLNILTAFFSRIYDAEAHIPAE